MESVLIVLQLLEDASKPSASMFIFKVTRCGAAAITSQATAVHQQDGFRVTPHVITVAFESDAGTRDLWLYLCKRVVRYTGAAYYR